MVADRSLAEFFASQSDQTASEIAASLYSDRACPAEETLRRIEPHLPTHGITRLARLTDLDRLGIPVWQAVSPNARSIVIHNGKGIADIDAKVSAAMEALERATAGMPALDDLTSNRARLIADGHRVDALPALIAAGQADIADDENIDWVETHDLIAGHAVWVPLDAVKLDRTVSNPRFWQSSDGLASGNTVIEATLHGLLERIERDATVLWNVSSLKQRMETCLDPASFDDPIVTELMARIENAGLMLRLFDITSDIDVPVVLALLGPADIGTTSRSYRYFDVTLGCGAHPSPLRAAIRAITEAAQSRLTFISGGRDDIDPKSFLQELPRDVGACFQAHPKRTVTPRAALPSGAEALLQLTIDRLKSAGIGSAMALRLSSGSLPFAVAKILVPQLENPDGSRKRPLGHRAISRSLQLI
ncbi:YcaO-like family protein [Rhizobium sp. P38BS-XIX]|uniref:YcaO-like family protein n=1 Tax=Rhizobium sp. P38BS-XIX TaxID=2726740 RepID=UPI00197CF8A5|nr:YcaO-like family protein [Rhizobium sp. P38BS-XIX]